MPNDVGSKWELLLAFETALNANYEQFRLSENTDLASEFGAIDDGGVDLFIPAGATFTITQNPSKIVDPGDCPVGYLALAPNKTGAMGPVSAAGEATVSVSLYLYVTDRISDAADATYKLTERELVAMSLAFEQATISAIRHLGANSVWTAGAGIKSPNITNSVSRSYNVDDDGDSITAIQIQDTWTMTQTVRY